MAGEQVGFALHKTTERTNRHILPHLPQGADAVEFRVDGVGSVGDLVLLCGRRRLGLLRCIHNLFHREDKVILLPEVDVEGTIFHLDVSLLEAFSPAIRILAGNVVLQVIPAALQYTIVTSK